MKSYSPYRLQAMPRPVSMTLFLMTVIISLFSFFGATAPLQAQVEITPYIPVDGQIASAGGDESWTFSAMEGEVISLYAQSKGDGLDPSLMLVDSTGNLISENDDIAYPGATDALLQAVTLPHTGSYTATVTGYKETIGGYTLTLLNGYPDLSFTESFADVNDTAWTVSQPDLIIDHVPDKLALSLSGVKTSGFVTSSADSASSFTDFYADATISDAEGRNGWIGGLTLRQQEANYYTAVINENGQWRFTLNTPAGEQVLRDWTNHPAIVAGQSNFRLGVLVHGNAFDLFYNSAYIGQAVDPASTLIAGKIGLYVETANSPDSAAQFTFDDLKVTVPRLLGDADLIPEQLVTGAQALTIQELERRRVIPAGGQVGLTVPESFGQRVNPGINRILLGRGVKFENMVFNTTLSWKTSGAGVVGCGLVFDSVSDTQYSLAYIDQTGGYGLSSRLGDSFAPGLFGVNPDWTEGNQNLLVIRLEDRVYYYVNRHYAGTMPLADSSSPDGGEIGVAVVNYETIDTSCQFDDTWIWSLPSP